jgi:hypothetical protein
MITIAIIIMITMMIRRIIITIIISLLALLGDLECVDYQTGANPQSHI